MRPTTFLALLTLTTGLPTSSFGAETNLNGHVFTLPDGFIIERVASSPLVDRPIVADYDEQGRLYVADSSGSNASVQQQLESKPHRIVRLEDTNHDGIYDKSLVFADKMMFPEGAMWLKGSLYISAPPSIWKLTDTNGDGHADQREEWFQGKTLTGCANDLHGPYRGPDGFIYWCKGAFAQQEHPQADGSIFTTRAAHIFRRHPEGGPVEPVMTGGMDNPIDVVFTPEGDRFFTTTFFQHPGGGRRDGLVHAIYGGVYGKQHNVIDDHPRTGDLMPVLTHLGPAAPCGLVIYESDVFGQEFQRNLFACNFNLHKITRHILNPNGSTFTTSDSDFLYSDQVDFHPTDILEDRDGSLIIIDTGGWYKICCPTSQLYKPDVLGAIYRIRKVDTTPRLIPILPAGHTTDSQRNDWAKLLGSKTPFIARRAMETLASAGPAAIPALERILNDSSTPSATDQHKQRAIWTLTRTDHPSARAAVRMALHQQSESVLQPAIHSVALWKDQAAVADLIRLLESESLPVQRASAEALGRIGDPTAIPSLLKAAAHVAHNEENPDSSRIMDHSLIYALIQINDAKRTTAGLASKNPHVQRAALLALDQMQDGDLTPDQVVNLLTSSNSDLRDTANWIVNHHPEWAPVLATFLEQQLSRTDLSQSERQTLSVSLGGFASNGRIQKILAVTLLDNTRPKTTRQLALQAMARSNLKKTPETWTGALTTLLNQGDPSWQSLAATTVRELPPPEGKTDELKHALLTLANKSATPTETRLNALAGFPGSNLSLESDTFYFLLEQLHPDIPAVNRRRAGFALVKAKLTQAQQLKLAEILTMVSPLELSQVLGAFSEPKTEVLGLKIIQSLNTSPARYSLRKEILLPALEGFPPSVQKNAEALLASLNTDAESQKTRLDQLMAEIDNGDIRRGQAVFNSTRAACSTCHAIGYLGGNYGPDLTRIGQIRTERDLLEAIVYPSVSFVRSYEPVVIVTKTEEEYSGILSQENAGEIILTVGPDTKVRVDRSDIEEMRPGMVSVMPGGLEEQLSRQELADLVTFLKATKW